MTTVCVLKLQTGAVSEDFYNDQDLTIGAVLNVWGRKITLCDCDDFTKEYYRTKYGISKYHKNLNVAHVLQCNTQE